MPEDNQEQEGNQQAEGSVNPESAGSDPVDPTPPEPGGVYLDTSMQVKDADVPWDVVQAQEGLPDGLIARGYFMFNGNPVLVCAGGFYGKHEGNVQRLSVKVLVDNI